MLKMMITFLFLSLGIYSMELSSIEFGEKIKAGTEKSVEYKLKNNSTMKKEYILKTSETNVLITPKRFILNPYETKKFKIIVKTKDFFKGKKEYYLEINELIKEPLSNATMNINKKYRIKQKYLVE